MPWLYLIVALLVASAPSPAGADIKPLALEQPSPRKPQQAGVLYAPQFDKSRPALAYFRLKNNWNDASAPDYLTFGQAFAPGALRPGGALAARYGDTLAPAQLDVKALHEDGSVRHAAVTVAAPPLRPGRSIDGALVAIEADAPAPFDARALVSQTYSFPLALVFHFADGSMRPFNADARPLLLAALDQDGGAWLDGPLVKEFRIETNAAPHLALRFDIRLYRDGDIRTSVVFANEKTFAAGERNMVYDVVIGAPDAPAFNAQRVGHHRASTWRRIFWSGAQPKLHVMHDLYGLVRSSAVAPLDASFGVAADIAAKRDPLLRAPPPLSPALVERSMPKAGGRPDIGLYPQWTAHYLVAQTEAAKRVMLANAEAAGAVPWHFVDDETNAPVSIETRPKFWADARGQAAQYAPDRPHPDIFISSDGGWTPDHSHKPSLSAVPYLVTADRYHADELAMQAAWAIFGRWPALREGGVKAIDVEQVRASAWSLRDLSDAAFLLPDAHPSKAYLERALATNLSLAREKYVDRRVFRNAGELEGFFEEHIEREPERISPWQNDYMALALWVAARRGADDAEALLGWSANFHTGRFLSPSFDPANATAYRFPAKDAHSREPAASWAALAAKMQASADEDAGARGYPELGYGYVASAHAALVAIASAVQSPSAYDALARLILMTKNETLWKPEAAAGVRRHNQFMFALTQPDGVAFTRERIRFDNGSDGDDFLLGGDDADELDGGEGADAIFGFSGNDVLNGGAGADRLSGGPGDDTLTGGPGPDVFIYGTPAPGDDTITDFNPAEDEIHISAGLIADVDDVRTLIEATPAGLRIRFTRSNDAVTLSKTSLQDLQVINIRKIQ